MLLEVKQMTRKVLVAVISLIYLIMGLVNVYYSLIPAFFSTGPIVINVFKLVGGALAFHAGLAMFRLNEFGRKLVIIWLFVRVVINVVAIFLLSTHANGFQVNNILGETIYKTQNSYALPSFLLIWVITNLLIIIFLSQKETKAIFISEATEDVKAGIILE